MYEPILIHDLSAAEEEAVSALFANVIGRLCEKRLTLSVAESCTGGLLGKLFTDVPGASAVFTGGMVTYTNHIKIHKLGVSAQTIQEYTEVSFPCAAEMAERAAAYFETELALSATGYAGPGGGTAKDPVGTVYLGLAYREKTKVFRLAFGERTRDEIRMETALFAAKAVLDVLS